MIRILILEDDKERHKQFRSNFKNAEIVIEETVEPIIGKLIHEKWDMLFLDHDLGGNTFVKSGGKEETGYDVAKFLNTNHQLRPKSIYCHSLNPVGRRNICNLIPAKELPFAWTMLLEFS